MTNEEMMLKALRHAETVLRVTPFIVTNANGRGPSTNTNRALSLVREALERCEPCPVDECEDGYIHGNEWVRCLDCNAEGQR